MYLEGNRMRFEQFDGTLINVADLDRKQGLILDMHRQAGSADRTRCGRGPAFNNPIDQLRRVKSDDAEPIGEEMLKGRRTQVYRFHKMDCSSSRAMARCWYGLTRRASFRRRSRFAIPTRRPYGIPFRRFCLE